MSRNPTVLFVDDEKNILHILRRELFDAPFNILLADTAQEGLRLLKENPVDLVISDIRMPDMDGLRFLEEVKKLSPEAIRAVLSGHLDEELVLSAITRGIAGTFFAKPWDPEQFRLDCIHMLSARQILRDPQLLALIHSLGSLPSLPGIYIDFLKAIDEGQNARQLAEILEKDTNLAVNILHMANTAYFSTYKITSLERALVQLGSNIIKNTVLTLALAHQLPWTPDQKAEMKNLMTHASLVSRLTALFHQLLHLRSLEELVNSAALTHDIGKILLLYYFPDRYREAKELMGLETGISFREAEIRINQHKITHCELGAYFLSSWNLPEPNINAALFHHSPQAAGGSHARLIHLIALANLRANLPADITGEEWLDVTREMPFTIHERRQLWENRQFRALMESNHE
jgi:response regulator RpfG family c-di-GMP phosphodiesterase